jgi:amino acid permease
MRCGCFVGVVSVVGVVCAVCIVCVACAVCVVCVVVEDLESTREDTLNVEKIMNSYIYIGIDTYIYIYIYIYIMISLTRISNCHNAERMSTPGMTKERTLRNWLGCRLRRPGVLEN